MPTLNELVQDIISTVRGTTRISDDEDIDQELIEYWIINTRNKLIRDDLNKGRTLSENIIQVLPCIPTIIADVSECCTVSTDCTIIRTRDRIPKPIEIQNKDMITRVAGVDVRGQGFSIIPYARLQWAGSSRWTKNSAKAFYHNGYIYIINSLATPLSITIVAEDPREAANLSTCNGTPCYTNDSNFPISSWMIPIMKDIILSKDFRLASLGLNDKKNDERADPDRQTQ